VKIHNEPRLLKPENVSLIEEKYNGKYVFESALKTKDGSWTDRAYAIFYTEEPHPEGSNYFAIGWDYFGNLIITNGISATEEFQGVEYKGEVYYSRYSHDFRECPNGLFVDGGRNYTRYGGSVLKECKLVKIRVNKDQLEIIDND
jgi:hypothetical protein